MVLLIVPPFVTAALLAAARPNWTDVFQAVRRMPPVSAFLFAGGLGLLLLPHATSDLITNSRRERVRWNAQAVAGALLCGIYATATTVALAFGRSPNIRDWILAGSALGCIAAAPLFFRIPWRTLAAAALLVAAIALRQRLSGAG